MGVDKSEVREWGIRPQEPNWQPTAVTTRQLDYLDDCIVICALELLSDGCSYDAEFRTWVKKKHDLVSKSVGDAFQSWTLTH